MNDWLKDLKRISYLGIDLLSLVLTIVMINQFVTFYQFVMTLHPILAMVVVGALVMVALYLVYQVWKQVSRNHRLVELNDQSTPEEIAQYYQEMYTFLQHHPHLQVPPFSDTATEAMNRVELSLDQKGQSLTDRADLDPKAAVEVYLAQLKTLTTPMIVENANAIFLTTAISQNGSLDSLVVFYTMLRMVWQLAAIYQTRPSLLSLGKLYLQVASVILMARTLEDSDLIEYQMEPLITSIIGESIASAIPGMVPISNLVVSSLMEGAINAFLTLRVGIIAQEYLAGGSIAGQQSIRRSASMQSFKFMGNIIKSNGKVVIDTIARSVKKAGIDSTKRWFKWGSKVEEGQ